jgi:hypothetical protein
MLELLSGLALGATVAGLAAWLVLHRRTGRGPTVDVHSTMLRMRSVGELVVFRMVSQQIVTAENHPAGRFREWVGWLLSTKKLALVIEYGIDFKYDLRDPGFRVDSTEEGGARVVLPPLLFQPYVRDIRFYDERNARWLPFLLGDITEVIGPRFDESEKNRMLVSARAQAEELALRSVSELHGEVQSSARRTFESLARGFGVQPVRIDFAETAPIARRAADGRAPQLEPGLESGA